MSLVKATAAAVFIVLLISACATGPPPSASDEYIGFGESESLLGAMNAAKMDAVQKAVIDMIGAEAEQRQRGSLEEVLYSTRNPNAYVRNETLEELRTDNVGSIDEPRYVMEIRIEVDRSAIRRTLDAAGISAESTSAGPTEGGASAGTKAEAGDADPGAGGSDGDPSFGWPGASPEQREFLRRYVQTMTYMVYFDEETEADPFLMELAVSQANGYLASEGKTVIDVEQVEAVREDARIVFEEGTGEAGSVLQWIARRLNADVYVEIDAQTATSSRNGAHFATATVVMRMFETSTAQLLDSLSYQSPETRSSTSANDAAANAVQSSVFSLMPRMVDRSERVIAQIFDRGIRYELVLQETGDARLMSRFRSRLRDRVTDLQTVSQTDAEARYVVHMFGRIDELEELVYAVSEALPGFEQLELILIRGKTITFNAGV
jgi:hypothetical protein